jgi:type VI secretion system ImpC/EvpB family protein/type VI secretion system ImpB/VipA family protein
MTDEPLPPDLDVVDRYPDGLKVTTDRPYRILLITDLAGGEAGRLTGTLTDRVADVTPETFDALFAEAQPTVTLKLADPHSPTNALTAFDLSFRTLKDFAPQAVLQQIPGLRGVLNAREQIVARLRGKLAAAQFVAALQKLAGADPQLKWVVDATHWTPSAAPPPDSVVDDVLGQLDLGEEPATTPAPPRKSPLGAVVAAAAAGGGATQIPAEESSALRRTLTQIDQRLTTWLNAVLHAAPVQRLESSWRSLALLVSRFDFRKGLRLSVLHASRDELAQRLVALVVDPVFDAGAEAPDLIAVHESFGNTAPEIEVLDELAQHAASLPVVVLAGASAEFFGLKHAWQVPTLPPLVNMFDQWQFAKWKTLREQPYARALGVVFGRCLLRAPYAPAAGDDLAFQYREECLAEKDSLWTNGAVAAACTIAHGMADLNWPTGIVGRLDGFPTARGGKKGEKQLGPTDTVIPLEKGQEMAMVGLNAVLCPPNQTDACVCGGFSAARPTRAEGLALLEVSLPYQLFASRLSTLLLELKPYLTGLSDEKLAAFVLTHVRDWLTVADVPPEEQQIAVQAKPLEDNPNSLQLAVTVTPPPQILPGGVPVVLGYRVR